MSQWTNTDLTQKLLNDLKMKGKTDKDIESSPDGYTFPEEVDLQQMSKDIEELKLFAHGHNTFALGSLIFSLFILYAVTSIVAHVQNVESRCESIYLNGVVYT